MEKRECKLITCSITWDPTKAPSLKKYCCYSHRDCGSKVINYLKKNKKPGKKMFQDKVFRENYFLMSREWESKNE